MKNQEKKPKKEEKGKISIQLNVFDAFVLLLVLLVGGVWLWSSVQEAELGESVSQVVRYTVLMNEMQEGSGALVQPGTSLVDSVRNYQMGTIVSAEVFPATDRILNEEKKAFVNANVPGYEDVYAVIETVCVADDSKIIIDGGYEIRVGQDVYMRGAGYLAVGYVVDIQRLEGGT